MLEIKNKVRFRERTRWIYMASAADHFVLSHVVKLTLDGSGCSVSSKSVALSDWTTLKS